MPVLDARSRVGSGRDFADRKQTRERSRVDVLETWQFKRATISEKHHLHPIEGEDVRIGDTLALRQSRVTIVAISRGSIKLNISIYRIEINNLGLENVCH